MTTYSNRNNIPLSLAVFLASDNYDYNKDPHTISVTTLLKPTRQVVLAARVPESLGVVDISALVQARMGQSIHDGVERSWVHDHVKSLTALGYPKKVIDLVRINPTDDELKANPDLIPIYLEQRASKKFGKWTLSGKFDFIGDGRVEDFKSTSTFTWTNSTKDEDYILQGSMYRVLNPEKITQDVMAIQFIFTDWSALRARTEKNYPPSRTAERVLTLRPLADTERFIVGKLEELERSWDLPEDQLQLCTDKELWRSEPVFKYYKNPDNDKPGGRSTKNFDNRHDAQLLFVKDGSVGKVKEVPGAPMACKYCAAFPICSQAAAMVASGDLIL
jgi:hypothetical protein